MTEIRKLANAFYSDAEPAGAVRGAARWSVDRYKEKHGGLWVGGNVTISGLSVRFVPNGFNYALHRQLDEIDIPRNAIRSISYKFGWFTGIVEVHHTEGVFMFRCYGAKSLVAQLNERR